MKTIFLTMFILLSTHASAIDAPKSAETVEPSMTLTFHRDVRYEGKVVYEREVVYLKGFKNLCKCCHYRKR